MVDEQLLTNVVKQLLSDNLWIVIGLMALLFLRTFITNVVAGAFIFLGKDFNVDDYVIIDGRQARIKHIGFRSTKFYMVNSIRTGLGTELVVQNERLKGLRIERALKPEPWGQVPTEINEAEIMQWMEDNAEYLRKLLSKSRRKSDTKS